MLKYEMSPYKKKILMVQFSVLVKICRTLSITLFYTKKMTYEEDTVAWNNLSHSWCSMFIEVELFFLKKKETKKFNMKIIMIPGDKISLFQIMGMNINKTSEDNLKNQYSTSLGLQLF